ncbi:methyl-accepting chemotaxis protein [Amphibiibacter pelophylacis]|uniref:Methyl-accepting chemotaxis protein n=1 Tax=Amphibiibacter pelophylacis TaxID=1799477 RepID=A0ACC6P150_9BURK
MLRFWRTAHEQPDGRDNEIRALRAELDSARAQLVHYRAIGGCMAHFSRSFTASQASMGTMAQTMQKERDRAGTSAQMSQHAQGMVHEMSQQLLSLAQSSGQSAHGMQQLHTLSQRINDMVELIQRIAAQTHLLSMNAAVEAARAGTQGTGFAAVAKEVQRLSADTDQATQNIVPLVRAIQAESNGLREHVNGLSDQAQRFSREGGSMSREMGQVAGMSEAVQHAIEHSAMRSFIELAKLDHLIFKFEIYKVFFGVSDKRARELADHTGCRMGKWYYEGDGRQCYSQLDGYRSIEAPHIRVHRHGRQALVLLEQGQADQAIADLEAMESASGDVVDGLERMAASHQAQNQAQSVSCAPQPVHPAPATLATA